YLSLNAANTLVQSLAEFDRSEEVAREVMLGLFNSAVLYSQRQLTQESADRFNAQLMRILERLLRQHAEIGQKTAMLERSRRQLMELKDQQSALQSERPDHIRLFMITPFADEYRTLEGVIRSIFERPPFLFEVQLARDYTHKPGLLPNVREHMLRCHGFIAEISDQSPNVMF